MKKQFYVLISITWVFIFSGSVYSQSNQLRTPYPIIFVHGIVGDNTTWSDPEEYDIIDFLTDPTGTMPLSYGGIVNVTLDYQRNTLIESIAADVHLFTISPILRDLYVINFKVHADGSILESNSNFKNQFDVYSDDLLIYVSNSNQFKIGDIIRLEDELMKVTFKDGNLIRVDRGILGSEVSFHSNGKKGYNLSYQSNQAAIAKQGYGLKLAIDMVKERTGSNKVILVCHSMGGLAAREYIRSYYNNDVAKIVTIGTPHYGANLADLPEWFPFSFAHIDPRSDAIRDLRSGEENNDLGVFLFGGNESVVWDRYYSKDVNCDGDENDRIQGLNDNYQHLGEMDRTWIASDWPYTPWPFVGPNDGIVLTKSQFISESDSITTHHSHCPPYPSPTESKDIYALIRGLDEPSEEALAYEISPSSTNKGFITYQIYNGYVDHDLFKINITDRSELTINVTAGTSTGIQLIQLLNSNTGEIQSTNLINEPMTAILQAGTYYIRVRGFATSNSYLFPYTLTTSATLIPPTSLAASPENLLEYYDVVMNNFRDKTVTLTNNGSEIISVANLEITGQNADHFSIMSPTSFDILPGENALVTMRLNPTSIGEKIAELVITNNSTDAPTIYLPLHGIGVESATKRLIILPDLSYNFGDNKINTFKNKTFSIQNTGSDALTISELKLEGFNTDEFLITAPTVVPLNLESGETNHITVRFSPLTIGAKDALLVITNNSDNFAPTHSIELYGNGTPNSYNGSDNRLVAYEYWFDHLYDAKVFTSFIPQMTACLNTQIPTDGLNVGLHNLHIRYKNALGKWSAVSSGFFHKMPAATTGSPVITTYEYWFDDNYPDKFEESVTPGQTITLDSGFNVDSLVSGLHIYRTRYKDDAGQWSAVVSEFFQKMPGVSDGLRKITAYEYWFDNNYSTKVLTPLSPNQTISMNSGFDISALPSGLHNYQVRYQDDAGQWSAVVSEFFHKLPNTSEGQRNITAYEYWFDDNYPDKFEESVTPGQTITLDSGFNVDSLVSGLHIYRTRYKDDAGQWSAVVSEFFQKMPGVSDGLRKITAYEYWFDNDYSTKVYTPLTPNQTINMNSGFDISDLPAGLHNYQVRYQDDAGQWSAVVSEFFHKLPNTTEGQRNITAYEYWFDDNYPDKFEETVTPGQTITLDSGFNVDSLTAGLHIYRARYQDDAGQWCAVVSEFFQKMPGGSDGMRKITAYEYWFDNDYSTKVLTPLSPNQTISMNSGFDISALSSGLHNYQVRYNDDAGQWSAVVSEFFHKLPNTTEGQRNITAYEYWFDDNYPDKFEETVTSDQSITINGNLNMGSLPVGMHVCHIRYKDDAGQWSSVASEFILKTTTGSTQANLITSFRYWFDLDDSNMLTISIPAPANSIHLIDAINPCSLSLGNHTIHVQFKDTLQTWSSAIVNSFTVEPMETPVITANGPIAICEGSSVTLTCSPANIYLWNTGEISRSIVVSTTGDFSVTIEDGCGNSLPSNTISVIVQSVPLCPEAIAGDSLVCIGTSQIQYSTEEVPGAVSYVWTLPSGSTGTSTTNNISVNFGQDATSGEITVKGVNDCGEGAASSLFIQINELPAQPSPITGNAAPLIGSSEIYSVNYIEGISFEWTVPEGSTIIEGQGTHVVTVVAGQNSGTITVTPSNMCGTGIPSSIEIQAVCNSSWTPLPNLQYNMQLVAQILIDGQVSLNPNDVLGAFVGDECRGIVSPQPDNNGLVFLTISSNVASGEQIELKIWNSSDCSECNAIPGFAFVNQGEIGTSQQPFQESCEAMQDITFGQGYTWFSLNVNPGSLTPASLFTDLTPCYDDRVIGQTSFALYTGSSWIGSLTSLGLDKMYRMKLCSQQSLSLMGDAAPLNPINLAAGYTWLGYQPQECQSVNAAMLGLNPGPSYDDRVIGQNKFALYNGSAWVGSLTQMCPGSGYVIKLANAQTLTYPATTKSSYNAMAQANEIFSPTGIYPEKNYQHTMMVVAKLQLPDGLISMNEKDVVYAYINGEVRGVAHPMVDVDGAIFLSIAENEENAKPISFMLWLDERQELLPLNETISFEPLAAVGNLENPFILTLGEMVGTDELSEGIWIGEPYPNPFNEQTTVPYFLNEAAEIRFSIYDSRGLLIRPTISIAADKGHNQFSVPKGALVKAVYVLEISLVTKHSLHIRRIKLIAQ